MNNKVLIKVVFPMMDKKFDLFIPVNESIYMIKKLISKMLSDIYGEEFLNDNFILINRINSKIYNNNDIVINTDIRNSSEVIIHHL